MSGRRQHDVPRFLLNGFASKVVHGAEEDEYSVWCFRKGKPPFEPNTKNVGLQKFFYGESGKGSLDDLIIMN
jgi:hypothetical protein